uniref:Neurturin-like n=1 Tax=Gadus morhua TaxID=8049 RepID=A0A8C5BSX7_GADMO
MRSRGINSKIRPKYKVWSAGGLVEIRDLCSPFVDVIGRLNIFHKDRPLLDREESSRWRRSPLAEPTSPSTSRRKTNRKKHVVFRDCRIEKKQIRVRDLGLGFDSDEIVLFKYCVGTCQGARGNYDLALKAMIENGSMSHRKVSTQPCCRPTRYETVSFMDAQTIWQTIRRLSAANCSCVG